MGGPRPYAQGPQKRSRWTARGFLAAAALLGALLIIPSGCASSGGITTSNSALPDMPRYAPSDEYIRQQNVVRRHLAAVRRHKEQERLEFKRREAEKRAIRWEKLQQMLRAAAFGRKESL